MLVKKGSYYTAWLVYTLREGRWILPCTHCLVSCLLFISLMSITVVNRDILSCPSHVEEVERHLQFCNLHLPAHLNLLPSLAQVGIELLLQQDICKSGATSDSRRNSEMYKYMAKGMIILHKNLVWTIKIRFTSLSPLPFVHHTAPFLGPFPP